MSIKALQSMIDATDNLVFFGGAGVSTESGIPDFRSVDGIYRQEYAYPPETILSHSFFMSHTEAFYDFYRAKMLPRGAVPNRAHLILAELQRKGKLRAVITQNIDGLHQKAGSTDVLELHGSVYSNHCIKCKAAYPLSAVAESHGVPKCPLCGGTIKPDVVLYEEGLNQIVLDKAVQYLAKADMLLVGGTSLSVYPAAGLLQYYRGKRLVLINQTPTPMDKQANLVIYGKIGEVLGALHI